MVRSGEGSNDDWGYFIDSLVKRNYRAPSPLLSSRRFEFLWILNRQTFTDRVRVPVQHFSTTSYGCRVLEINFCTTLASKELYHAMALELLRGWG